MTTAPPNFVGFIAYDNPYRLPELDHKKHADALAAARFSATMAGYDPGLMISATLYQAGADRKEGDPEYAWRIEIQANERTS